MRAPLIAVLLAAAATTATAKPVPSPPPAPAPATRAPTRPVTVRIDRTMGDFDSNVVARALNKHGAACRRRGASGRARLTLMLTDRPDRRGMRVTSATGDASLRRCLGRSLAAATWPTGRLDAYVSFTVTIRVAP